MKLFITFLFIISLLNAQDYPKFFAALGTPLFKADAAFTRLSHLAKIVPEAKTYHEQTQEVLKLARFLNKDPLNLEMNRKRYVQSLRTLKKEHDLLMHKINTVLIKSIDKDDYKAFSFITSTDLKALSENEIILKRIMSYYVSHRTRGIVKPLEPFFQHLDSDKKLMAYVKDELPKVTYVKPSFATGGTLFTTRLAPNEKIAYVASGTHCFKALDIQDTETVSEIGAFEFVSNNCALDNISLSSNGNYAYLSDLKNGFAIVDISQPEEPLLVGRFSKAKVLDSAHFRDDSVIFVIQKRRGLSIINTKNKDEPRLLAKYSKGLQMHSILLDEANKRVYLTHDKGLSVLDISTLGNPRCIANYEVEGGSFDIKYSHKKEVFYLASGKKGVQVLNISDNKITLLSNYHTLHVAQSLSLNKDENRLFISTLEGGVCEVNTLDSLYLKHIINYRVKIKAKAYKTVLNKNETKLFISYGQAGLVIVDREN